MHRAFKWVKIGALCFKGVLWKCMSSVWNAIYESLQSNILLLMLFSLTVNQDLSEPVDVYSDWIDACETANQ